MKQTALILFSCALSLNAMDENPIRISANIRQASEQLLRLTHNPTIQTSQHKKHIIDDGLKRLSSLHSTSSIKVDNIKPRQLRPVKDPKRVALLALASIERAEALCASQHGYCASDIPDSQFSREMITAAFDAHKTPKPKRRPRNNEQALKQAAQGCKKITDFFQQN